MSTWSIGRAGSRRLTDISDVNAHPLLSQALSESIDNPLSTRAAPSSVSPPNTSIGPSYAVYQPRLSARTTSRASSSSAGAATVSNHAQSSSLSNSGSSSAVSAATLKLQIQNLQAEMQSLSLRPDSIGWALLMSIVNESSTALNARSPPSSAKGKERAIQEKEDHDKMIKLLETGSGMQSKITLLLPKDSLSAKHEDVSSPSFLADHILLSSNQAVDVSQREDVATLSGLRGTISGLGSTQQITFQSCIPGYTFSTPSTSFDPASSKLHQKLLGRTSCSNPPPTSLPFPAFSVEASRSDLSVPRQLPEAVRKPLPPPSATTSRLASLFAGSGSAARSTSSPAREKSETEANENVVELPSTPSAASSSSNPFSPTLHLNVVLIDRPIRWVDVVTSIRKSIEVLARTQLDIALDPYKSLIAVDDAVEHCVQFLHRFSPPSALDKKRLKSSVSSIAKPTFYDNAASADEVGHAIQDLYDDVRESLQPLVTSSEADDAEHLDPETLEAAMEAVLESTEQVLTEILYDRIFCPYNSNDDADDESLSGKIAGLSLLQLSLENLGLDIGAEVERSAKREADMRLVRPGLEGIAKACGSELKKLEEDDRRSPRGKLEVLITMHKIIVDRLTSLPPVPMKADSAAEGPSVGPSGSVHEMTDDARSLGSKSRPETPDATPRLPSRPSSILSDRASNKVTSPQEMPSIVLPDAALGDDIDQRTPNPNYTTSYFDIDIPKQAPEPAPSPSPSSSSADLILPILIYSIVQANPRQLASHLAFIQRFRSESLFRGEGQYCLVNAQAVLEFLLNVDMTMLGLSSDRIMAAENSPIIQAVNPVAAKRTMTQDFDTIAGHVTSTISSVGTVVDGGYRMLGSLLAKSASGRPRTIEDVKEVLGRGLEGDKITRESLGVTLLRRASAAPLFQTSKQSTDSGRLRSKSDAVGMRMPFRFGSAQEEDGEKELTEVSSGPDFGSSLEKQPEKDADTFSVRSVTSFSNMMGPDKMSIGDRLASLARFGPDKTSTPGNRTPPKAHSPSPSYRFSTLPDSKNSSNSHLPAASIPRSRSSSISSLAPPIERFLTCDEQDLRIADVSLLLQDYRRLAKALEDRTAFAPSVAS